MIGAVLHRRVLDRLGVQRVPVDAGGLRTLYSAWCRAVPFDNLRKIIALRDAPASVPLPGIEPDDFFTAFLAHGTGGTCWPTSEAWLALLLACGFDARRVAATMLPVPVPEDSPGRPNHGSTIVTIDGVDHVVDTSMLSEDPLVLGPGPATATPDPVVGIDAERTGARWLLRFMPWRPEGRLPCELDPAPVAADLPAARYEFSRTGSPFNGDVHARRNLADRVLIVANGSVFRIDRASGETVPEPLDGDVTRRDEVLVGEMGYSEEIVARLPAGTVTA